MSTTMRATEEPYSANVCMQPGSTLDVLLVFGETVWINDLRLRGPTDRYLTEEECGAMLVVSWSVGHRPVMLGALPLSFFAGEPRLETPASGSLRRRRPLPGSLRVAPDERVYVKLHNPDPTPFSAVLEFVIVRSSRVIGQ